MKYINKLDLAVKSNWLNYRYGWRVYKAPSYIKNQSIPILVKVLILKANCFDT